MQKEINFQNPFNGRKWLKLLKTHPKYGMTFIPNLDINEDYLGFSFRSNKYGLRGQGNEKSSIVICGTSYAMGLSVNNGENWYELSGKLNSAFNIAMPISPKNHSALLDDYYKGDYSHIIYIYHPNIWSIAKQHEQARDSGVDIFTSAKWETNFFKVLKLYLKWKKTNIINKLTSQNIVYKYEKKIYSFTKGYSYMDFKTNQIFIDEQIKNLDMIFSKFKKVTIIRVPIKEEIGLRYIYSEDLKILTQNYNKIWNYFKESINDGYEIIQLENDFNIKDYLPFDTHWSKSGNKSFYHIINKLFGY